MNVKQKYDTWCIPAALENVFKHFGNEITQDSLVKILFSEYYSKYEPYSVSPFFGFKEADPLLREKFSEYHFEFRQRGSGYESPDDVVRYLKGRGTGAPTIISTIARNATGQEIGAHMKIVAFDKNRFSLYDVGTGMEEIASETDLKSQIKGDLVTFALWR